MKKKHKKIFPVSKKMVSMLATALAVSPAVMIHTASAADTSFVVDEGRSLDIDLSTLFPNTGLTFGIQTQTGTHFTTNLSNSGNNKDDTNNIMTVTNISTDSSNNFIDNFEIKGVYSSNQSYVSTIDVRLAMRPVATDGNDEYRYVGQNPDIIIPLSDLFTDQDDAGLNGNVSVTEKVGFDYVTLLTWGSPTSDYAYSTDNVLNFHSGTGTTTKTLKVTYTDNDYSSTNSSIKFKSHSIDKVITLNMNHDPVVNADWANDDNGIGKKTFDVEQGAPVFIPYAGMFTDPDGDVLGYTTRWGQIESGTAFVTSMICSNNIEIFPNAVGSNTIYVDVADGYGGYKQLNFKVNVHPKLSINLFDINSTPIPPIFKNTDTISLSSSAEGTVYLIPTTERIANQPDMDRLVAAGKALKRTRETPGSIELTLNSALPDGTSVLPDGAYKIYYGHGSIIDPPSPESIIITSNTTSNFISALTTNGKIDISTILSYINNPAQTWLKGQGKFDASYMGVLLNLISPKVNITVGVDLS